MRSLLCVGILLSLFVTSVYAERKPLDVIQRQIKTGVSEVKVPNEKRKDGYDVILKNHEVNYDENTGLYTYTYWRDDGTQVDILYEPSNRLDVTVACSVTFNEEAGEYTYTYTVKNKPGSAQSLGFFTIDVDPKLVLQAQVPSPWRFISGRKNWPSYAPKWAAFGSTGGDIPPGGELSITIVSQYGPVITTCHSQGRARTFDHPGGAIDALGVYPPNVEGITGRTLGPGEVPIQSGDLNQRVRAIMDVALEWGWVDSANYNRAIQKVPASQALDAAGFAALMRDFKTVQAGAREPEVGALLNHLGKHQFNLTPDSVDPGGPSQR